ncbi:MAG: hypothetical protein COB15_10930 [Flavobacteriales bacterium]|nr:MAG: hypothetical protein COB15_10930 [Flavobacteriales bacterium]
MALLKAWPHHEKLELHIGKWSSGFSEQEIKIIIAVALNNCVHHKSLKIIGYLLTSEKIFLIVTGSRKHVDDVLTAFNKEIAQAITEMRNSDKIDLDDLYEEHPFTNQYLIQLITGQKIELRYYNAEVERLKDKVSNANFCSAMDYAGAKGPVLVTTKWKFSP